MRRIFLLTGYGLIVFLIAFLINQTQSDPGNQSMIVSTPTPAPTPSPTPPPVPASMILDNDGYHTFQTFNNCGPASLSMALSYYDIHVSQQELGQTLRPHQNPQGDNDDKSVTLAELADKATDYGLLAYHRPNGNLLHVKQLISQGFPVLTRTLTKLSEDIGHFRVVKGYDDKAGKLIQDDSLQGKNLYYDFQDFLDLWQPYGYEFLVLVPPAKKIVVESILADMKDSQFAWQQAADHARTLLSADQNNLYARFNLSVALYHLGDFQASVDQFEQVESSLPFRTLWYQIEPIQAYFQLGQYDRVFALTDTIINGGNRAFSELYFIRGQIHLRQNNLSAAKQEFEQALHYNSEFTPAKMALQQL